MGSLAKVGGRLPRTALALALASAGGLWFGTVPTAEAQFVGPAPPPGPPPVDNPPPGLRTVFIPKKKLPKGTLGYGPPGLHQGYQGFGLGYFLGYGYGGAALGTGAEGGFPYYGGPGYPHDWPKLNRIGPITPFSYFGGPGGPTAECPNYFGGVGALVNDPPVIEVESEPDQVPYEQGYGCFTGTLPYPESTFAPFTTRAGTGGSAGGSGYAPPATSAPPSTSGTVAVVPATTRSLAIAAEPFVDPSGTRGVRITQLFPDSIGARAGLQVGDVIQSINNYAMEKFEDIGWVIANAARDGVLNLMVRSANDGQVRAVRVVLP